MKSNIAPLIALAIGIASICAPSTATRGQDFPSKAVTIIVPFAAGGSSDVSARVLAQKFSDSLGKPVIVDNRPGANGQVAASAIRTAAPDGHTLMWVSHGVLAINPSIYAKLTYDPVADFAPISLVFRSTHFLLVPADSPYKSAAELVKAAKDKPGKLTFASVGVGSGSHLVGELFRSANALDVVHVPYKGSTSAIPDVLAGRIDFFFDGPGVSVPLVKEGKFRALAVTDTQRYPELPDIPTMAEVGFPKQELNSWFGLVVPAGTPAPIIAKWHQLTVAALGNPDSVQRIAAVGGIVAPSASPAEFVAFIAKERERLGAIAVAAGVKPE
jgi:tripartite-type tricarboxylate transporter receptor subunit TctC